MHINRMLIVQVLPDEPRPPLRLNDKIPRDLETICLKAMAKDRSRRYATGRELADELRRWLAGEPTRARPVGATERLVRWCRRNPLVAAPTAAAAALFLFIGMGGLLVANSKILVEKRAAVVAKKRADDKAAEAIAEKARADQKSADAIAEKDRTDQQAKLLPRQVYFSHMNLAQAAWENAGVGRLLELLGEHEPKPREPDLRGFEWHYWNHVAHSYLLNLKGHTGGVTSVAFSPDGQRLASASHDETVKVWDAATGQESLTLKGRTSYVERVAFSADGQRLAAASHDVTVMVWDARPWTPELRAEQQAISPGAPGFLCAKRPSKNQRPESLPATLKFHRCLVDFQGVRSWP